MAKSPEEMAQTMVDNLKEKTGKNLKQWLNLIQKQSFEKHGEVMNFLKGEHEMTHGFANLVAQVALKGEQILQSSSTQDDELVVSQYSGKDSLKPIYDAIVSAAKKLGSDVVIAPKKAYVSLRRNKQFALIQPSTKTRVDLGLNLKDVPADGRLEKAGSFNSMVSHRVRVTDKKEVDAELKKWLQQAYKQG